MGMCAITFCCPLFCICSICCGGTVAGASHCCCQRKVDRVGHTIVPVYGPDGQVSYEARPYTYQEAAPLPLTYQWIGSSLVSLIVGIILYIDLAKKCGEDYEYESYYWDSTTNSTVYNGTVWVEGPGFSLNPLHTEGSRCWSEGDVAYFGLGFFAAILLALGAGFLLVSSAFYYIYGKRGCTCPNQNTNENPLSTLASQNFVPTNNQIFAAQNIGHNNNTILEANRPTINSGLELQTQSPFRQVPTTTNQPTYHQLPIAQSIDTNSYSYSYPSISQDITDLETRNENEQGSETSVLTSLGTYKKDAEMNL